MARLVEITRAGGPDVITWVERDLPPPGAGEVRMRNTAVGLNFIDTYQRTGLYPAPLPHGIGVEAAGIIEAVGADVHDFTPGDRVATFGPAIGAYATERNLPADSLFHLPDTVSDEVAAAVLLKGCTVEYLVERCAKVQPGWTVLVHAAAGGTGQLLVQWLHHIGATVIATVGHRDKIDRAHRAGAAHVLLSREDDMPARVREITGGAGVPVVLDGVGAATWEASLAATARRGLVISFGNASGPVEGVALSVLNSHGSLFVTRPSLGAYYVTPAERTAGAARLFALLERGVLRPEIGQRFALADAADAHRALEAGTTQGSTVLIP